LISFKLGPNPKIISVLSGTRERLMPLQTSSAEPSAAVQRRLWWRKDLV